MCCWTLLTVLLYFVINVQFAKPLLAYAAPNFPYISLYQLKSDFVDTKHIRTQGHGVHVTGVTSSNKNWEK
jgi:hypothetical protein